MNDRPLLICYDGSEGAGRAIDVAGTLFHGHSAVVLDIVGLTPEESLAAVSPVVPDFEELNIPEGQARARQGVVRAQEAGLVAEPRADFDVPTWDGVVRAADELDAELIVLGSRGLSGVQEFLKGSVSHEVAEHAGRPVLIVPPEKHA